MKRKRSKLSQIVIERRIETFTQEFFLSINKSNQNEMFIFLGPSINQANKTSFSNDPISKVKTNRKLINDKFS